MRRTSIFTFVTLKILIFSFIGIYGPEVVRDGFQLPLETSFTQSEKDAFYKQHSSGIYIDSDDRLIKSLHDTNATIDPQVQHMVIEKSRNYESIALFQLLDFNNPVSVTLTLTHTATSTLTPTGTRTPTKTNSPTITASVPTLTPSKTPTKTSSSTATITPTPSRTHFPTAVIPSITLTPSLPPSQTPTLTSSSTITPTSTLESFPTVVYTLKDQQGKSPTLTLTPTPWTIPSITPKGIDQAIKNLAQSGNIIKISWIILILAIWGILSVSIYIYFNNR